MSDDLPLSSDATNPGPDLLFHNGLILARGLHPILRRH